MLYKLLGHTGIRVSELCLGTMTFGEDWGWGASKETCKELVTQFLDAGGNFIDTANYYTNGSSELILGEVLQGIRQKIVLGTKYSLMMNNTDINSGGNQRKNMMYSLEESLKRLKTDYVDIFWVHIWDQLTPIEEVIRGLEDLVRSGKVLHTGISDTPAWLIAKANAMSESRNWTRFNAIQIEYNLIERTSERELIPMAQDEKLSVLAWSPLAGGLLSGKYSSKLSKEKDGSRLDNNQRLNEHNLSIADTVVEIANATNVSPSTVALSWIKKNPVIIPIIGARKTEQLKDNLNCLQYNLAESDYLKLEEVSKIKLGFPHDFINSEAAQSILHGPFRNQLF